MTGEAGAAGEARRWRMAATAIAVFIALLLAVYVVHARFLPVDVVFYSALQDAAAALALTGLLVLLPAFRVLSRLERAQLLAICALGGYAFAISLPTVLDRSLSFYLLEKLDQRGGGIRADALERVITDEYMAEYRVVDARLTEQLESGTIVIRDGCVVLTPKGRQIVAVSSFTRRHLLPRHRQLMGEYTDALTDPLAGSRGGADYGCR